MKGTPRVFKVAGGILWVLGFLAWLLVLAFFADVCFRLGIFKKFAPQWTKETIES